MSLRMLVAAGPSGRDVVDAYRCCKQAPATAAVDTSITAAPLPYTCNSFWKSAFLEAAGKDGLATDGGVA